WLLIVPIVVVIFFVLVMSTIFAGIFWMLGAAWPWLLIGLGMWMFLRHDGRHHRARRQRLAWSGGSGGSSTPDGHEHPARHRPVAKRAAPTPRSELPHQPELPIDV